MFSKKRKVEAGKPDYPYVGYEEFVSLYNKGRINLIHIIEGGKVERYDIRQTLNARAAHDDSFLRRASHFSLAFGREAGIERMIYLKSVENKASREFNLETGLERLRLRDAYKNKEIMKDAIALSELPHHDYVYMLLATKRDVAAEQKTTAYISLKDAPKTHCSRYVLFEQEACERIMKNARQKAGYAAAPAPQQEPAFAL